MNEFSQAIGAAKSKQKRLYFWTIGLIFMGIILIAGLLVEIDGTPVDIAPIEAKEASSVRLVNGIGFILSDVIYSFSSRLVINVSADGFVDQEIKISASNIGKRLDVKLEESPSEITIITNPAHKDTKWISGTTVLSRSSSFKQTVAAGQFSVTADNAFFIPQTVATDIRRGEQKQIQIDLQPAKAMLDITSVPQKATIILDGMTVGVTPLKLSKKAGSYHIKIKKAHFETVEETIKIARPNLEVKRSYRLEAEKAYLSFQLSPQDGDLLVDGIKISPVDKTAVSADRSHKLTYEKNGYFAQTQTINLSAGGEEIIIFNLQKELGIVQLTSRPTARVTINGKIKGNTPMELELPAIAQEITFEAPGYIPLSKIVTPNSKSTQSLSVILVDEAKMMIAKSPAEYTNKAGLRLKLFRPNDTFLMGAPRHEKGQRANEFMRKVLLDKPFYASVYEVSNAQYSKFKKTTSSLGNNPVTNVTWLEAVEYCNWLSKNEGLPPFYITNSVGVSRVNMKSNGYRLLSEAEWEWLARKAKRSKQTKFTWGNKTIVPAKAVNIADESAKGTLRTYVPNYTDGFAEIAPVGSMQKEISGLYDIGGNVSEWVHESYNLIPPLSDDILINPMGDATHKTHVVKGANWQSATLSELRPAFRDGFAQGRNNLGFRVGRYITGDINE